MSAESGLSINTELNALCLVAFCEGVKESNVTDMREKRRDGGERKKGGEGRPFSIEPSIASVPFSSLYENKGMLASPAHYGCIVAIYV